jgi:hypothetical protein
MIAMKTIADSLKQTHDSALAARPKINPRQKEKLQAELAERKLKANQAKRLASSMLAHALPARFAAA